MAAELPSPPIPELTCALSGRELICHLEVRDGQVWVTAVTRCAGGHSLLREPAPLCLLRTDDTLCETTSVRAVALVAVEVTWDNLHDGGRAVLRAEIDGESLRFALEITGETGMYGFRMPALEKLTPNAEVDEPGIVFEGARTFCDRTGQPIFRHADWPLPVVRETHDGQALSMLAKSRPQQGVIDIAALCDPAGVALSVEADAVFALEVVAAFHQGGWRESFGRLRDFVRADFDLSQYARPDLAWFSDQLVQHFTFLYGREILNLESGEFELDRFLDEAERDFGGYDGFLIWGVYPRIGVDERTQWDFFDDFPGGRAGLRDMARRARARGVRLFVPYKPWDRSPEFHGSSETPHHDLLAQLVADVEADGVFLDTMAAVKREFRDSIDHVRPGVVFCSEGRAKGEAFEVITSSWDQSSTRDPAQGNWSAGRERMPRVDLWRFIFPEHRLFVINRHAQGRDRKTIIQRGFFNGMGWVVWQDIFGLVLAYSPEEAALLKRCRTIMRLNRCALASSSPTPLVHTLVPGVHANEFPCGEKRLWTLYNETCETVEGEVLVIEPRAGHHYVDLWDDAELDTPANGALRLCLEAGSVGAVVELPRILAYDRAEDRVSLRDPIDDAEVHIWRPSGENTVAIDDLVDMRLRERDGSAGACRLRLLRDGELLDQIWVRCPTGGSSDESNQTG